MLRAGVSRMAIVSCGELDPCFCHCSCLWHHVLRSINKLIQVRSVAHLLCIVAGRNDPLFFCLVPGIVVVGKLLKQCIRQYKGQC